MKGIRFVVVCVVALGLAGCGGDGEDDVCDRAWELWCACPEVACEGSMTSCTGPDKEWAECILAAEDACTAACTR